MSPIRPIVHALLDELFHAFGKGTRVPRQLARARWCTATAVTTLRLVEYQDARKVIGGRSARH